MIIIHAGACFAPFYFTWGAFWVFLALQVVAGLGITLGYHRMLTHASFETYSPIRFLIALAGSLANQGGPIMWVSEHRKHHQFSDKANDPHSPVMDGFWYAHMGWFIAPHDKRYDPETKRIYAPDLLAEPGMRLLDKLHMPIILASGLILYLIGGLPWLFWGFFLRLVVGLHVTWSVNSVTHTWGYRNHHSRDGSRNNYWVAIPSFGEGFHNNHHAFPTAANHGQYRGELPFDTTYWLIWTMEKLHLAWDVRRFNPDTCSMN
jgi:stearoyl-CoA desaturase (delta-9 desaturase)